MRVCHCYFNHFALKFAVLCLSTHAHMQLGHHVESEPDLNLLAGPPPIRFLALVDFPTLRPHMAEVGKSSA